MPIVRPALDDGAAHPPQCHRRHGLSLSLLWRRRRLVAVLGCVARSRTPIGRTDGWTANRDWATVNSSAKKPSVRRRREEHTLKRRKDEHQPSHG